LTSVNVVRLSVLDQRLLAARFAEHGNSHRRMRGALLETGIAGNVDRLDALRRVERSFEIDLGSLCHRHGRRNLPETHPVERLVLDFITEIRLPAGGDEELWVHIDRVAQVRNLMHDRLVGEPDA
jgi:hypothetical protein